MSKTQTTAMALVGLLLVARGVGATDPHWTPQLWVDQDTMELRTTRAGEAPHWFKVWVAIVDDQVYARLGSRASDRIEHNTTAPEIAVRIAGQEFDHVRVENAPQMAERVAAELAEKYWSDLLVRYVPHPLTVRLVPQ